MDVPIGEGSDNTVYVYLLLFADDQVLIAQEYEYMDQKIIRRI